MQQKDSWRGVIENKETGQITHKVRPRPSDERLKESMLWHMRLGHVSIPCLQQLQKNYSEETSLKNIVFGDGIIECETRLVVKVQRSEISL